MRLDGAWDGAWDGARLEDDAGMEPRMELDWGGRRALARIEGGGKTGG
jgi:hypothetical protein